MKTILSMVVLILVSTQVYSQTLIKINRPSVKVMWTFQEEEGDSEYFEVRTRAVDGSYEHHFFTVDTSVTIDTSMVKTGWYSVSVRALDASGKSSRWVDAKDCQDSNVEQCFLFRLKDAVPNVIRGLQLMLK